MRNRISAKFSNTFLFLMVSLLLIWTSILINAQVRSASVNLEGTAWQWEDARNGNRIHSFYAFYPGGRVTWTLTISDMTMGLGQFPVFVPPAPGVVAQLPSPVIMPPKITTYEGTWSQKGDKVSLQFPGVESVTAIVNGDYINGKTNEDGAKWIVKKVTAEKPSSINTNEKQKESKKISESSSEFFSKGSYYDKPKKVLTNKIYEFGNSSSVGWVKFLESAMKMRIHTFSRFDKEVNTLVMIQPFNGYQWIDPSDSNDVRVKLMPGLKRVLSDKIFKYRRGSIAEGIRFFDYLESIHLETVPTVNDGDFTILHPVKGFRWRNPNNLEDTSAL